MFCFLFLAPYPRTIHYEIFFFPLGKPRKKRLASLERLLYYCGGLRLGNADRTVVTHVSMDDPLVGISHRGHFPPPRYVRYLIEPDMPMTETLRGPPDHSLFPHRKREGGSLLALNTRKKTAALGSGSKLPLPRNRWRLYDSRGLHIGVDDEIRTHAGKANGNITFRSGAGI